MRSALVLVLSALFALALAVTLVIAAGGDGAGPRDVTAAVLDALSGEPAAPVSVVDRSSPEARALAEAAMSQVGVTVDYDPSYVELDYPGGDVPVRTGVCTDVVIRALRARGVDLQVEVHEDMREAFSEYPRKWGLTGPDPNIDHRRVPNLQRYFARIGKAVRVTDVGQDYQPGDIVTWDTGGRPHIGLVSTDVAPSGDRWMIVHNYGRGTCVEDILFAFEITGHYRYYR